MLNVSVFVIIHSFIHLFTPLITQSINIYWVPVVFLAGGWEIQLSREENCNIFSKIHPSYVLSLLAYSIRLMGVRLLRASEEIALRFCQTLSFTAVGFFFLKNWMGKVFYLAAFPSLSRSFGIDVCLFVHTCKYPKYPQGISQM